MKKIVFASAFAWSSLVSNGALAQTSDESAPPAEERGHAGESGAMEQYPEGEGHAVAQAPTEEGRAPPEEEEHWYDHLTLNVFADAFFMVDWNHPRRADATSLVPHRSFNDFTNGFALAFAGIDAAYATKHFGATINLRFGQGAQRLIIGTGSDLGTGRPDVWGLRYVYQAFVSWMPNDQIMIDLGQFSTPYGAEVAESWLNMNYSRTPLYYLMQPFYHTGLRATYQVNDQVLLRALVVNGINNGIDNNLTPYLGFQAGFTPSHVVSFYGGYLTGSNGWVVDPTDPTASRTNKDWEHLLDGIVSVNAGNFRLTANGDLWMNPGVSQRAGGVSVVAGYKVNEWLRFAVRGDALFNGDHYSHFSTTLYDHLYVGTATVDLRPFENDHVIVRIEHRYEHADARTFPTGDFNRDSLLDPMAADPSNHLSRHWNATTVSMVVRTGQ